MNLKRQNILLFTRTMEPGGTENVVLQLCEILKPRAQKVIVCSCGGVNERKLKEMGIKHYLIPDITNKTLKTMLTTAKLLRFIVKAENITVIHSHHRMAAFYTELLFGKSLLRSGGSIIRIASAHNTFSDKRSFTRLAYRHTHVIAVGETVKKNLNEFYGLPEKQVTVIHNAVKPFDGKIRPVKELQDARAAGFMLIGNVGRLSEQKGMTYFIQAAAKVRGVCPKTKFFIVGSGELEEKLKAEAGKLLPESAVVFLGYRSDIQNVMSQLDFVVLSSLWEGFPLTPIEAFSAGKAVVATAVDGTPEIVKNRETGLLVPPGDADALAEAMIEMAKNKEEREQLEKNASRSYKEEFSFERMAERYVRYYGQLGIRKRR